jgi:hypothetical protein
LHKVNVFNTLLFAHSKRSQHFTFTLFAIPHSMTTISVLAQWRNIVAAISPTKSDFGTPLHQIIAQREPVIDLQEKSMVVFSDESEISLSEKTEISSQKKIQHSPATSRSLDRLNFNTIVHIMSFLTVCDIEQNLACCKYFHNYIYRDMTIHRRLALLNNDQYDSQVSVGHIENSHFETVLTTVLNGDEATTKFLLSLLSFDNSPFVIGGSLATMIACLIEDQPIDLMKYKDSDVDIYLISEAQIEDIDRLLKQVLSEFIDSETCVVYDTNVLFEIVFADDTRRKIQIIRQVKKNIDMHMEFIDLPCTQFAVGKRESEIVLWSTNMARIAITTGINYINDPIHPVTNNRIVKYEGRNFTTAVLSSYNRVTAIFDEHKRNEVDATFKDCEQIHKEQLRNNLGNIIRHETFYRYAYGVRRYPAFNSDSSSSYETTTITMESYTAPIYEEFVARNKVSIVSYTNKIRDTKMKFHSYRDNKKSHTFANSTKSKFQFLEYLKSCEIIVFRDIVAYFLKNQSLFKHSDGVYRFHEEKHNRIRSNWETKIQFTKNWIDSQEKRNNFYNEKYTDDDDDLLEFSKEQHRPKKRFCKHSLKGISVKTQ